MLPRSRAQTPPRRTRVDAFDPGAHTPDPREILSAIVESSDDAIISKDFQGNITSWNKAAERILGYTPDEIVGKPISILIPRDRLAEETEMTDRLQRGERIEQFETIRRHKNGSMRDISVSASPIRNRDGNIVGAAEILHDLTRFKKTEATLRRNQTELKRSESQYRTLFASIDIGFCVIEVLFDPKQHPVDYRFLEINPAFEKQTGLVQATGKTMRELAPAHEQHWFDIYGKVALTGKPVRFENRAEALQRWYDVYAFRVGEPEERKVAVLFTDITGRKNAEETLRDAQQKLANANRYLEQVVEERTAKLRETVSELESFSYTVSHDLRSPLRAMQAFAHMTLEEYGEKLDETGRDYLQRIDTAARRMDSLIQDVIAYNRVARADIRIETVDTEKVIDEVIHQYPSVKMPHATFEITRPLHKVRGSPSALMQVLSNLLTNAVKFVGEHQKVSVRIWTEAAGPVVRLFIQDNGIGIPQEVLPKIFEPFQRGHPGAGYEGTGIGLAIVKKAVGRMRGRIGAESEVGRGSKFWIELPAAP